MALNRQQLVQLVHRIQNERGCIFDVDGLITQFEQSVPNPSASQLIFDSPSGRRLSPEEIVDAALRADRNPGSA